MRTPGGEWNKGKKWTRAKKGGMGVAVGQDWCHETLLCSRGCLQKYKSTQDTKQGIIYKASYSLFGSKLDHLLSHHPDDIGELLGDQVAALEAWLSKSTNLLLYDCLKCHVRGEQAHSDS